MNDQLRAGGRTPIGVQLVALLLVSLLLVQVISFVIILMAPPPRPPVYRMFEVAQALRGGSLVVRAARPLVRSTSATLPADLREAPADSRFSRALAATLNLPQARVRVVEHTTMQMWLMRRLYPHRGGDPFRPGMSPPPDPPGEPGRRFVGVFRVERPGGGERMVAWRRDRFGPAEMPIFGGFTAAMQQPNGAWLVIRSAPETFPTEWQLRTGEWFLATLIVAAAAGYLFSRRITSPLQRFATAAETLGRDPHAPQMALTGPAEIGVAADAFNRMQARLKRYIDDRTAMVGAISHDLRTPLARMRFKLEAASPSVRDSVLTDVAQMEQMIGDVLAFIRDEGAPHRRERLELLSLVECVADDAAMVGGDVCVETGAPVTVDGDAVSLTRMFANLVDNAIKYGGHARIAVSGDARTARVTISDGGGGLTPEELTQVFTPFYRADASRNLDNGGVGLGLPIARSTARAHGGDIELASGPGGTTATVTLPACAVWPSLEK